jgi:membrane-bound metal-dependent hydrolase YbcI (DUF457 family)
MPSPVGHALGGLAAGWLLQPRAPQPSRLLSAQNLTLIVLAVVPDLDLLTTIHRGITHSIGAAATVGVLAWLLGHGPGRARTAAAAFAACGSHVVLDWMGVDTWAPFGVPALWPLSDAYLQSPWQPFAAVSRRFNGPGPFWQMNALAVGREIVILLPLLWVVGKWRRRL